MTAYSPFYAAWHDLPLTDTPTVAASFTNTDNALLKLLPSTQTQTISAATGSWSPAAAAAMRIVQVSFSAAGRLRLYTNSADRTTDSSRAFGTLPTVAGILYDYNADTNNVDPFNLLIYVGSGTTVYWQNDGGATVTVNWIQEPGT